MARRLVWSQVFISQVRGAKRPDGSPVAEQRESDRAANGLGVPQPCPGIVRLRPVPKIKNFTQQCVARKIRGIGGAKIRCKNPMDCTRHWAWSAGRTSASE